MADDKLDEIKKLLDDNKSNVNMDYNFASGGLNMDQSINQIPKGQLTYALNAALENFDANSISYQNEGSNVPCLNENNQFFPLDYILIGTHFIQEKYKHIFFLANPVTGDSEIGYMNNNDCNYRTLVNAPCLNFNIVYPIHKVVHKITNCTVEIYWTDGFNPRRYLDINNVPYKLREDSIPCDEIYTSELDCNQLKLQPNFKIPQIEITNVVTGGNLIAGTYQFAIQYSDASGNPYTSYYSVTNPTPIADIQIITPDFNYPVGKSIVMSINNLDNSGQFQYYNIAVIKTINNIPSIELVGTYNIDNLVTNITYTGQSVSDTKLTTADITEKYPYYDIAQDLTAVQDVLVWDNLTSIDRINYQSIATGIDLQWQTYKIPANENYADELNATNLRGYLRDEVYAFEIAFLLKNGKQTDGFHIPGRPISAYDNSFPDVPTTNADFIGTPDRIDAGTGIGYSPYWKIYNTANVKGGAIGNPIGSATPYEYGEFAYWESEEEYPCNEDLWGDLAGQKIRHHKFPDVLISPIFENPVFQVGPGFQPVRQTNSVFPIGVKIDIRQINTLIRDSFLTQDQKDDIVGFKIIRGDRGTNKSIVAKGILRNVNQYTRNADGFGQSFYFPNYPYNDLNEDPFIIKSNNSYSVAGQSEVWFVQCTQSGSYSLINPSNARYEIREMEEGENYEFCSLARPIWLSGGANIGPANYNVWRAFTPGCDYPCFATSARTRWTNDNSLEQDLGLAVLGFGCQISTFGNIFRKVDIDKAPTGWSFTPPNPLADCVVQLPFETCDIGVLPADPNVGRRSKIQCEDIGPLPGIETNSDLGYRQVFNSPETSFGQPFLGGVLKLENVMFGAGKAHFVQVRDNAKYRLLSKEAQQDALKSSFDIAGGSNYTAVFTAYQAYLTIYVNGITRKNYAQSFNSIASYDYYADIDNNATDYNGNLGIKQREIDLKQYLIPGVQSVGDDKNINNFQRESSVYIRTAGSENNSIIPLPYPNKTPELINSNGDSLVSDYSRFTISETGVCNIPDKEQDIQVVSYYASMKNIAPNQWGQMYSYETIDTGFQRMLDSGSYIDAIFGGDTFISRFAFKTKLPFFLDNRVGAPNDSDIFYDEIGNVGYPKYWHSARSILYNYNTMANIISVKAHNFDCANVPGDVPISITGASGTWRTFYDGYFYLFAYGIPNFFCETSYNVDLRQARDNRAGDFWPHVSTGIPDDWVQQTNVPIAFDNTYYYNVTFSKQNKENSFSHLPADWTAQLCFTNYPFRAIYSDPQEQNADNRVNNWFTYAPLSLFDFPQNYGNLISLDGIQNKAVLARFENKSLLYNNLLVMDTSNPQSAYLGGTKLFGDTPPIDFAETDLGYVGSQNKFLLKIPQGQITIDAKRGQVFLIQGTQIEDLSALGTGMNRFFTDHLAFEILRYFPSKEVVVNDETIIIPGVDVDNHFNGIGLHGVYDSKFDRVIITKLDYIPIDPDVKYDPVTKDFYIETVQHIPNATSTTSTTLTSSTTSTTSTSSTSTSTTTTTTTAFVIPSVSPCVWSRDINVVDSIDVYDVVSNTTISISVPNDFATPTGITMQASTNNKLWIGDGINTIKEWDIMQETLGLSFVRNINVSSFGPNQNQPSTIAAIDDVTILLGSDRVGNGPASIGYWDITNPAFTISLGNSVASRSISLTNSFGITQKLTGIIYTNSGNIIISCRNNFASSTNNVGNFIGQYVGLPDPDFMIPWLQNIGAIRVQNTIDFTLGYTGRKAFDLFVWNGIVYLVNPETSDLYEVSQTPQYGITLLESNLGYSDTQTFWTSTGCSNVNFEGYSPNCIPTSLPGLRSTSTGPYIGPVNFTYLGMTVQASSVIYQGTRPAAFANTIFSCSGLSVGNTPTVFGFGNTGSCSLDTPAFDYTLTFPSPVNNIPFRFAVLDGNDDFRFTTNGGTPTITANINCNVDIIGNELYTIDGVFYGSGSGEFVITAPSDYTQVTISGTNCGNGGPIWLGCYDDPAVTTSTTTLFPPTTTTTTTIEGVNTIFTYFEGVTP